MVVLFKPPQVRVPQIHFLNNYYDYYDYFISKRSNADILAGILPDARPTRLRIEFAVKRSFPPSSQT